MITNRLLQCAAGLILLFSMTGCSGISVEVNVPYIEPPTVSFSAEADLANPFLICFHATISGGLPPYNIRWDFMYDGVNADIMVAGDNPCYEYLGGGEYLVLCRADDSWPYEDQLRPIDLALTINVQEGYGIPPTVQITTCEPHATLDYTGHFVVEITGGVPYPDDPHYQVTWDFDYDGDSANFDEMTSGYDVSYTYPTFGSYQAGVKVEDSVLSELDPGRPVYEVCIVNIPDPTPPLPDVVLSWYPDGDNPHLIHFHAEVTGGVPMDPPNPPYGIKWDFIYQLGGNFDEMGFGEDTSYEFQGPGTYLVGCHVSDSIPSGFGNRPRLGTTEVPIW